MHLFLFLKTTETDCKSENGNCHSTSKMTLMGKSTTPTQPSIPQAVHG